MFSRKPLPVPRWSAVLTSFKPDWVNIALLGGSVVCMTIAAVLLFIAFT